MFVMARKEIYRPIENCEDIVSKIRNLLKKYIEKNSIKSLIIGVSGGIDSALCCALAKPVCDSLNVPLIGRSLPIFSNKYDEILRAKNIGEILCSDFKEIYKLQDTSISFPLEGIFEKDDFDQKIRIGNLKARLRMIYLYDLAYKNKGMVLSTDNLTEFLLGFWTLHGDVGDYGMIQSFWKTEVYQISKYLKEKEKINVLQDCIDAIPTDGLGISNSDLDQIKAKSYEEVDNILQSYILDYNDEYENHPVILRYKKSMFKRDNPFNLSRSQFE